MDLPIFRRAGLRLAHFGVAPAHHERNHRHATSHLLLLLSGQAQEAGRLLEYGTARLSGADVVHDIEFGADGGSCLVVHFPGSERGSRFLPMGGIAQAIAGALASPRREPAALLAIRQAMALFRTERDPPPWLMAAHALLAQDLQRTINAIAAEAGVSREHFARTYRRYFGVSPLQARLITRTVAAAERLRTGSCDSALVAFDCGFSDQSHLIRAFRSVYGCSPGAFARRLDHKNPIQQR